MKKKIILAVAIAIITVISMWLAKMTWESELPGWLKVMLNVEALMLLKLMDDRYPTS